MLDWTAIITAIITAALSGTGVAAFYRTRNQNRVDAQRALSDEQIAFRRDMAAELSSLRAEIANLKDANQRIDERNDSLVRENGELQGRVRFLEEQNADLKNQIMNERAEKEAMKSKIAKLEEQVRGLDRRTITQTGD